MSEPTEGENPLSFREGLFSNEGVDHTLAFETFWQAFPKRVDLGDAEVAFMEAIQAGVSPDVIMAGVARYRLSDRVQRGYIKAPAKWLRTKCWADEEPAPPPIHHGGFLSRAVAGVAA